MKKKPRFRLDGTVDYYCPQLDGITFMNNFINVHAFIDLEEKEQLRAIQVMLKVIENHKSILSECIELTLDAEYFKNHQEKQRGFEEVLLYYRDLYIAIHTERTDIIDFYKEEYRKQIDRDWEFKKKTIQLLDFKGTTDETKN